MHMFESLTRRVTCPPAFGLDISDLTVKFMRIAARNGDPHFECFGEIGLPEGIIANGEIKKEDDLGEILATELRAAGRLVAGGSYCVASLPEEKSFVRMLELPDIPDEDAGQAIKWEVEGVIPLPLGEIFYDYELAPRNAAAGHRDALIIAFPRNIIQSYQRALKKAGLTPLALELESQAISRAVVSKEMIAKPLMIIDIGAARTSFIIFAGGSLIFTKSILVGGRDLDFAISKGLDVPVTEARRLKIESGLNEKREQGRVSKILLPLISNIISELSNTLWFYRDRLRGQHREFGDITCVYLCGGDANLIGLEKRISTAVKKTALLANPFANLEFRAGVIPSIPKNESLKYTTAIGLALRAAGL